MAVIQIHNVEFDGMTENVHYARPDIETVVRAGSGKGIVQVRRHVSHAFELYPWVFVTGVNQPFVHIVSVRAIVGKKVKVVTDIGDGVGADGGALIVQDFRHRARTARGGFLIQYTLQCLSTLDTPIDVPE